MKPRAHELGDVKKPDNAMDYQHVTTPELRSVAVKAHTVILKAIVEQDEEAAFKRMNRHLSAYRDIAARPEELVMALNV